MPKADPKYSAGARAERAAVREYLRRYIKRNPAAESFLTETLVWVMGRQKRYDGAAGGLGKK